MNARLRMGLRSPIAAMVVACLALVLAGCGDGISGTYSAEVGPGMAFTIEFKSGGKATISAMGEKKEGTYTVSGDTVTVTVDQDPATFVRQKDGSLVSQGNMAGMTLKKK